MYIPEALGASLGLPFIVVVLAIIGVVALLWIMYHFDAKTPSACTHDCNQGRNCTCGPTEADKAKDCPQWPFPCPTKP